MVQWSLTQEMLNPDSTEEELERMIRLGVELEEIYKSDMLTQQAIRTAQVKRNARADEIEAGQIVRIIPQILVGNCIINPYTYAITLR